jgi:hypothetical protein
MTRAIPLCLLILAGGLSGAAAPPLEKLTFRVTNDTDRIVECALLVDGHTRTYLKVHPGKAYFDNFYPRQLLQLACIHAHPDVFGPLKPGSDYRFTVADGWVGLAEGSAQ